MKRVFITGASSGIGADLALFYARRGDPVAMLGRRLDALQAVRDSLPGQPEIYVADVHYRAALHAAARAFLQRGPVAIVIASSGISDGNHTEEKIGRAEGR